jgi:hypothetical protein
VKRLVGWVRGRGRSGAEPDVTSEPDVTAVPSLAVLRVLFDFFRVRLTTED